MAARDELRRARRWLEVDERHEKSDAAHALVGDGELQLLAIAMPLLRVCGGA